MLMMFESSGRRHGPIGWYSSRWMTSNIATYVCSLLTGTLKADWIQLPIERYLAALPTLKQSVIAGVFKIKDVSPWAITSVVWCFYDGNQQYAQGGRQWFSPHTEEVWCAKYLWGNVRPRWRLLQQHLETKGSEWYSLAEREERLFTNRSNQPMIWKMNSGLTTISEHLAYCTEATMAASSTSSW